MLGYGFMWKEPACNFPPGSTAFSAENLKRLKCIGTRDWNFIFPWVPGLLCYGASICGLMNVWHANDVVSRCSPTTQSAGNELRVIGMSPGRWILITFVGPFHSAPFLLDVSVKNIWILKRVLCIWLLIRFAVCWVNKLGLPLLQIFWRDVCGCDTVGSGEKWGAYRQQRSCSSPGALVVKAGL